MLNPLYRIPLKLTRPEEYPFAHRAKDGSKARISTVHFDRLARFRTIEPRGEETPLGWWQGPVLVYVRSPSTGQHSGLSDRLVQSTPFFLPFKSTLERKSVLASSLASSTSPLRIRLPPCPPSDAVDRGGNSDDARMAWGWPG